MASASASSIQKSFKYDVFLSFRGEDTRKTFVDHLYHALHHRGITTYKDDERIEKGKRIDDQLIRSIEESRFYIIVFSKNYASSSWCLEELVKIMECQRAIEQQQTAYPIFYDVEPTEVRNQSGPVGKAFAKHVDEDAAGRWRDALKEAASLAGWELKNTVDGHEAKFIQHIVKDISLELSFINWSVDENLVGMETRVKSVVSSLEIGIEDVRMIGIWGMGGGGKTTLATTVFDHLSVWFEGISFVENVREVSKSSLYGLKDMQKQVLSNVLNDQSIVVKSVFDGKNKMKKMMGSRKVLVVLDDVDDIEQLEALAGKPNWFKPGSRIIITTRDEQVLIAHRVNIIHDVNLLSCEEAICLFSRYAFGREVPVQGYEELSKNVIHYAAGLPLTIKVLGSYLCGRSEREWADSLERLKTIPLKETLEKLELSYNGLENDQKEIFLDVSCLLKGEAKKRAIRILESCGFRAQIGLSILEQKSLITISKNDYDGHQLLLHDHIVEMGWNIVRRLHPDEPSRHSRLWIDKEIDDILVNESGTEATKSIHMCATLHPSIIMKGLRKMKELRFLHVHNLYRQWEVDDEVSQYLPDALRSLYWHGYPFQSLPKTFRANNLVNLEMPLSKISQLWEVGETKVLDKLKYLDLTRSKLKTFDFMVTPNLVELNLEGCDDLIELQLPVEFSNLKILTLHASMEGNLDLSMTPHIEKLNLHACDEFELHMPVECPELIELKLNGSKVSNLNLGLTPHLEKLCIRNCKFLQELHAPVGCLKKLVHFILDSCLSFKHFLVKHESADLDFVATLEIDAKCVEICPLHPNNYFPLFLFKCTYDEPGPSWSGNLEKLISSFSGLCACKNLEYLSASICGLQYLRELTLEGCIPGDLWQLQSLEKLSLSWVETEHLPYSICTLKHLKSLTLEYFWDVEQLPEDICRLDCLEELYISTCPSLRNLPNSICNMKCLKRLNLFGCDKVEKFPEELGHLECLKELIIFGAGITHLPQSIYRLKGLRITGSREQLQSYGFTSFTVLYQLATSPCYVEL